MYRRFTDTANAVMDHACVIARELNYDYLGVEHVLWGLARYPGSNALVALDSIGLNARTLEHGLVGSVRKLPEQVITHRLKHTIRLKTVIGFAYEEPRIVSLEVVRTEHLLLGLLRESGGIAYDVLTRLGVSQVEVRDAIESLEIVLLET